MWQGSKRLGVMYEVLLQMLAMVEDPKRIIAQRKEDLLDRSKHGSF
jgi:hypothetical protein